MMTDSTNVLNTVQLQALIERKHRADAESAALNAQISAALQSSSQQVNVPYALQQDGLQNQRHQQQQQQQRQNVPRTFPPNEPKMARERSVRIPTSSCSPAPAYYLYSPSLPPTCLSSLVSKLSCSLQQVRPTCMPHSTCVVLSCHHGHLPK